LHEATFIELEFRGREMLNMDKGGLSDPYLVILRPKKNIHLNPLVRLKDKDMDEIYRTSVQMNTLKPHWNVFQVSMEALCDKNGSTPIIIQIYDWDSHSQEYIGEIRTDVHELLDHSGTEEWLNLHQLKYHLRGESTKYAGCLKIQRAILLKDLELVFDKDKQGRSTQLTAAETDRLKSKLTGHAGDKIRKSFEDLKVKMETSRALIERNAILLGINKSESSSSSSSDDDSFSGSEDGEDYSDSGFSGSEYGDEEEGARGGKRGGELVM
jgi:hypothetical protein